MSQPESQPEQTGPDHSGALRLIGAHLHPFRWRMVMASGLSLLAAMLEMLPYLVVWQLLGQLLQDSASSRGFLIGSGLALLAILTGHLANALALAQSHLIAFNLLRNLRLSVAHHLAKLPLGRLRRIPSGEAKQLLISEPERLELLIAHALPEGISALSVWLLVSLWLAWVDPVLALVAVLPSLASFVLIFRAMASTRPLAPAHKARSAAMNAALAEELAAMPLLASLPAEAADRGPASRAIAEFTDVVTELARRYVPLGSVFFALVTANICFILPVGLWRLAAGGVSLPELTLFLILGAHYSLPLLRLFNLMHHVNHALMGATVLQRILAEPEQPDAASPVEITSPEIRFEGVSLSYGETEALRDISLSIRPGTLTALVGPSGAGKSSLIGLIPRFEDPDAGKVTLGGHDLCRMPMTQLMEQVSFVFQDTVLFADSVAENLRMARPEADDAALKAALTRARAWEFVAALPDGIHSRIGAGGVPFSGGESQRIAIARALLKDAPILVLDEATASLDPDCEAEVQAALQALMQGRTVIAIAHRLHTVAHADCIHVLDQGRVVQSGRHEDLLGQGGLYRDLWADYSHHETGGTG